MEQNTTERLTLTREMKATILNALKNGYLTEAERQVFAPAPLESLTDEELQQHIDNLQKINYGMTDEEWRQYKQQQEQWLRNCTKHNGTDMANKHYPALPTDERLRKYYDVYLKEWQERHSTRSAVMEMIGGKEIELKPATFEHFCAVWRRLDEEY